jgi:hypothetical protein
MNSYVRVKSNDPWRAFIASSGAPTIMGEDEGGLLHLWREKRGEAELEGLFGKPRRPCDRMGASPVRAAHAEFVAVLAENPPRTAPITSTRCSARCRSMSP